MGAFERAAHQCDTVFEEVGQNFDSFLVRQLRWVYARAGRTELAETATGAATQPPAGIRVDPVDNFLGVLWARGPRMWLSNNSKRVCGSAHQS